MNNSKSKTIKTLIVILIGAFVTLGITIGICCYNYFGYVKYKVDYLDDYFDELNRSNNQDKLDKFLKFQASHYSNKLNVVYRDPETGEEITGEHVTSGNALNVDAHFDDGTKTLYLPKFFDINLYQYVTQYKNPDTKEITNTITYCFYLSSINYNTIQNFSPANINFAFIDASGEKTLEDVKEALNNGETLDTSTSTTSVLTYALLGDDGASKASYGVYDNDYEDTYEDKDETNYYYIHRVLPRYDFFEHDKDIADVKKWDFIVYHIDPDHDDKIDYIVEGTFEAGDQNLDSDKFINDSNTIKGYNAEFYQESYNSFIAPKIALTGLITFLIVGVLSTVLAVLWLYDHTNAKSTSNQKKSNKKNKK